jgi:hypothetical protein
MLQLEAVKHVIVYRITAPNATRKDYRDEAHQEAESQHIFYFLLEKEFSHVTQRKQSADCASGRINQCE